VRILGISAFYHDSAAALVQDGRVIAAAQEERFTRKKFDAAYPRHAIDYCLRAGGIKLSDVDRVVFYDKPFIKFERLLETYLSYSPRGLTSFRMALPLWLREKLFQKSLLTSELKAIEPEVDWQQRLGARFATVPRADMLDATARALADGEAVGWFQGRMEFGPRALGNRSILGDPRSPTMQKNLNLKVKYRESFRPFAPSVLRDEAPNWFELDVNSPYMLLVAPVAQQHMRRMTAEEEQLFGIDKLNVVRSTIPAVTHVDYSARVQTVHRETNPTYYELISRFHQLTGCPVVINTSFNVRSEPIVCTPEDAFRCFMGTELDLLVVGNALLRKQDQDPALKRVYKDQFELD
jgi:predicted NodU family carbamoyl transferase